MKQVELRVEMLRHGMRYRDLARALRERGLDTEESDVLAVVCGKRRADDVFKRHASEILGRPTFELFH